MKKDKPKGKHDGPIPWRILIASMVISYVVGVSMIDRFSHPELTETQLLMRFPKALIWMAE